MRSPRAKILRSRQTFQGRVFGIRIEKVREPGGVVATREIVTHHGSVVILPVFGDGSILLVRQYRHAAGRFLWELVAGHVEPGESLLPAARRELAEESGCTARRWRKLTSFFPSPGLLAEQMHVFLAAGLTCGAARPEDDERIAPRRFSLAAIERMIRRGAILDAKTIAAVLFYARFAR